MFGLKIVVQKDNFTVKFALSFTLLLSLKRDAQEMLHILVSLVWFVIVFLFVQLLAS